MPVNKPLLLTIKKEKQEQAIEETLDNASLRKLLKLKQKFQWLLEDPELYDWVREAILSGYSIRYIVLEIQRKREDIAQKFTYNQLYKSIKALKENISIFEKALISEHISDIIKLSRSINELKELIWLYRTQVERIKIDLAVEKGIKKLLPGLNREIALAMNILNNIALMKEKVFNSYVLNPPVNRVNVGEQKNLNIVFVGGNELDEKTAKKIYDVLQYVYNSLALPGSEEKQTLPEDTNENNESGL
ncbi:MAG: hypothetical protein QW228_03185 [Candidatus Aenigmatarchaeota archaeon]